MIALLLACRVEVGPPSAASQTDPDRTHEVWVYTSMYQEVIDKLDPLLKSAHPEIQIQWFQSGSEKIAQRLEAEGPASKACLLATSDPGWYADLAKRDLLVRYVSPDALTIAQNPQTSAWISPFWTPIRVSLMVMATNGLPHPTRFSELAEPAWKDRISSGDPLSSGTTLLSFVVLENTYGEAWFEKMHANGLVAAGGNSAVLSRLQTGERPYGVILLENLLLKPDPRIMTILPQDGAIPIPGLLAIPKTCPEREAAIRVYDWLLGPQAQQVMLAGKMYSPLPGLPPPDGAPALDQLTLLPLPEFTSLPEQLPTRKARFQKLFAGTPQ